MGAAGAATGFRLTELVAAISLATDLGTGQPMEHALRTCRLSATVAAELGLDRQTRSDIHYVALLRFLGCVADAPEMAHLAGGSNQDLIAAMAPVYMGSLGESLRTLAHSVGAGQGATRRVRLVVEAMGAARSEASHCEVGARLATRLGLGDGVVKALAHAYERWDGRGLPDGLAGEAVPIAVRVVVVARDAILWQRIADDETAFHVLARRRGHGYDPAVVDATRAVGLPDTDAAGSVLEAVVAAEPEPVRWIGAVALDRALAAVGDFADLRSRWTRGRSARVHRLAVAAGRFCGLADDEVTTLGHAALVADLGAVGVPAGVWQRSGPLGVEDIERVRLHPYLSERVLHRCGPLAPVAALAGAHHERIDGSGYYRRASAAQLSKSARILAAADVWSALGEDRAHRPAHEPAKARDLVWAEVAAGRLDTDAVDAVLAADGQSRTRVRPPRPAGLSDREIDVLALIARGHSNREVAAKLSISVKTVGHHVGHIYTKIGVTTRPAAALFAMEHDLLRE